MLTAKTEPRYRRLAKTRAVRRSRSLLPWVLFLAALSSGATWLLHQVCALPIGFAAFLAFAVILSGGVILLRSYRGERVSPLEWFDTSIWW